MQGRPFWFLIPGAKVWIFPMLSRLSSRFSSLPFRITTLVTVLTLAASLGTGLLVVTITHTASPEVIGVLIAVPLIVSIGAGLAAYALMRSLFRPLDRLSESAARLATGDLETAIS